ncbi:Malonyl-CoA-acyl carrier protein transacylase [Durusdinium trenchii]|uniref:Mitochondrial n=1 Tax=Durusdinium trenchii TaxID=1381693 RepID=A0ABP0SBU8_9DINO
MADRCEALEAPMMLHWLARGLGVQMAPMLRVNRAMHEQMKPRLPQWRPDWLRQRQFRRIARVAREAAEESDAERLLDDARHIQELAKGILRVLGADTFGHFKSPSGPGDYLKSRFLGIADAAVYANFHLDEQVPESWRIFLHASAVEQEILAKEGPGAPTAVVGS